MATLPVVPLIVKASELKTGLKNSELIYLSPIKTDGAESTCKSELWFLYDESSIYVVTQSSAWRADAIRKGLTQARIWIGGADRTLAVEGKLDTAPSSLASAELMADNSRFDAIVDKFGVKYSATGVEWDEWGPRWRASLGVGSRVMLRYTLMEA